ncbi:MAG TPA: MFS transporter [Rhizomicrobium sp.]|jgi:MFS family permease|nr:MFS transporter [Rhizomicrobium sp.]
MTKQILSIAAILLSTAIFLIGNGLMGTVTPVRANLDGFSDLAIGLIGSAYFAGFVLGCLAGPRLLARVGFIRTFAVAAGLAAVTPLLQALAVDEPVWFIVRGLFGFSAANLYMVIESWLNERATNETRGRIFSAYLTVNFMGLIAGQLLFMTAKASADTLFMLGAIAYALCLIPVGLTQLPQPSLVTFHKPQPLKLFRLAPVGVAGCVAVGLANGAVWTLAPVYAADHGLTRGLLAIFMVMFTLGGVIVQVPLGRLSDMTDRRYVIAALSFLAAAGGLALAAFGGVSNISALLLVALYGTLALPLYGLSVAHANDRLPRELFIEASATLLLINAVASVLGPTIAALITAHTGTAYLFVYTAAVHLALAAFTLARLRTMDAPPEETREPFAVVLPQASPVALELDPRGPESEDVPADESSVQDQPNEEPQPA